MNGELLRKLKGAPLRCLAAWIAHESAEVDVIMQATGDDRETVIAALRVLESHGFELLP